MGVIARCGPLTLTEHDLQTLRGINEKVSLREVEEIYLPLSRLLNLYVKAKQRRSRVLEQFLGQSRGKGTYIISIAGSVAGERAPRPVSFRHCWSAGRSTPGWSWSPPTASCFPTRSWKPVA